MYSLDGRIPMLPGKSIVKEPKCLLIFSGLNNFEYARAVTLRHRYPTCGLISNKVILDIQYIAHYCLIMSPIFLVPGGLVQSEEPGAAGHDAAQERHPLHC